MSRKFIVGCARSFKYAAAGVGHVLRTQRNAWVHAGATITVLVAGVYRHVSLRGWCWLIGAMGAVWAAEAMNTAVELLADAACPHHHPLVGRAKDVAAGAVLLAALAAAAIGLCVFAVA